MIAANMSRLSYNLYCVGGDVKHCTIQSNTTCQHFAYVHYMVASSTGMLNWCPTGKCCCAELLLASHSYSSAPWKWLMHLPVITRSLAGPVMVACHTPSTSSIVESR